MPALEKKILIIEDETFMREITNSILRKSEYKTYQAKNGLEGISLAFKILPDLILCDIEMPHMNGLELYDILQSNNSTTGIPFIFLTARSSGSDIRAMMQRGVDDYINQPFDSEELLKAI